MSCAMSCEDESVAPKIPRPSFFSVMTNGSTSFSSSSSLALLSFNSRLSLTRNRRSSSSSRLAGDEQQISPWEYYSGILWKWRQAIAFVVVVSTLVLGCLNLLIYHNGTINPFTILYPRTTDKPGASAADDDSVGSGMDDLSCLSRKQQHILFRGKESLVSEDLSRALRAHEEMQASCYHQRNLTRAFSSPDAEDPCKYLVYLNDAWMGLGNQILSLVSAFLYALLTNRMLLIDSRGHLSKLLCEPFSNSSWILPPDFPYSDILRAPLLGDALKQDFKFGHAVHLMLLDCLEQQPVLRPASLRSCELLEAADETVSSSITGVHFAGEALASSREQNLGKNTSGVLGILVVSRKETRSADSFASPGRRRFLRSPRVRQGGAMHL